MECRENSKSPLDSIHLLKMSAQRPRELALANLHGSSLIASEPARWSIPLMNAQMGYGFYGGLRVWRAKEQPAEHIITSCPIYHHPNGPRALSDVEKSLATRLIETCPAI